MVTDPVQDIPVLWRRLSIARLISSSSLPGVPAELTDSVEAGLQNFDMHGSVSSDALHQQSGGAFL